MSGLANRTLAINAFQNSLRYANPNIYFRKYTPTFRETFGDVTRWVPTVAATCEVVDDPNNYTVAGIDKREDGSWVPTAGKAMKLTKVTTTTTDATVWNTLSEPIDLSGNHAVVKFYVHEGTGDSSHTTLQFVRLSLWDSTSKRSFWTYFGRGGFKPGWYTIPFANGIFATEAAGFNVASIAKIDVGVRTFASSGTPSVTFDFVDFFPKLPTPIPYILTFDGGYSTQKPVLAYCAARGIRAHVYVTYDEVGKTGRMTLNELKQAQAMGHFIDTHERNTPPIGFDTLTKEQKVQSILESLQWKAQNGFTQGRGFAPLRAEWNPDIDNVELLEPWLEHVRIGSTNWTVPYNPRIYGVSYDTNFLADVVAETTARTKAVESGLVYIGLVHGLTTGLNISQTIELIENGVNDPNVKFTTIPELIATDLYA